MNKLFLKGVKHGLPIGLGYLSVSFAFGMQCVGGGLTVLLKADGTPVVTPVSKYEE